MKRSKTWDMRYHWVRDKATQKEFRCYWQKGALSNTDYFTTHDPPSYHTINVHFKRPPYETISPLSNSNITSPIYTSFSSLAARVC